MTLRTLPFPLALAGLLASVPAQRVETEVTMSLRLDTEPERLEPMCAVLGALLKQPMQGETLAQAAKLEVLAVQDGAAWLQVGNSPNPKPVGIVECRVVVTTSTPPTAEQRRVLHDQLAAFVVEQLRAVTEERPRRLLHEQIQEQQQRWDDASERLHGLPPGPDLAARAAALQQQRQAVDAQIAEARLVLAVESRVRDRLRKQQEEQGTQRAEIEERRQQRLEQCLALQTKAAELRARIDESTAAASLAKETKDPQRLAAIQSQLQELQAALRPVQQQLAHVQAAADDATRTLDEFLRTASFALEQLPTTELLLLRTEMRLQALADEQKRLETEEVELAGKRATAARAAAGADLLRIDLQVARDRLTELKGRLARIEPLRLDVLSGR